MIGDTRPVRWMLLLGLASCYRASSLPDDAAPQPDTAPDGSPTMVCAGHSSGLLPGTCFDPPPPERTLTAEVLDTDTIACDQPALGGSADVCILAGASITFESGPVVARGSKPLVLWSATTIVIPEGVTLDVGSHGNANPGAGANDAECPLLDGLKARGTIPDLGSGGCGGPFGGAGGAGGAAQVSTNPSPTTLASTCVAVRPALDRVRGGCRGGHGGLSDVAGSLNGGFSGGAVYLMAAGAIEVGGIIDARGTGGNLATVNANTMAGGGGGGSGGLIAFDTPMLVLQDAILSAVGGGGSSGGGLSINSQLVQGVGGLDASLSPVGFAPATSSPVPSNFGGGGGHDGTNGGSIDTGRTGGGGGGGGGVGYIKLYPPEALGSTVGSMILPSINAP